MSPISRRSLDDRPTCLHAWGIEITAAPMLTDVPLRTTLSRASASSQIPPERL